MWSSSVQRNFKLRALSFYAVAIYSHVISSLAITDFSIIVYKHVSHLILVVIFFKVYREECLKIISEVSCRLKYDKKRSISCCVVIQKVYCPVFHAKRITLQIILVFFPSLSFLCLFIIVNYWITNIFGGWFLELLKA